MKENGYMIFAWLHDFRHSGSTPLLKSIAQGLKSRLINLSEKFTVTELLTNWEMSVRQVTNSNPKKLPSKLKGSGGDGQRAVRTK